MQRVINLRIVTNGRWTSDRGGRTLRVIEPPSQSDRAFIHFIAGPLSVPPLSQPKYVGCAEIASFQSPLAFDFSKTRTICDAFDDAWAFLLDVGNDLTEQSNSLLTRTILAKRIIEMADQGLTGVTELRDDALAFLERNPPSR
jgi:hypothetical protein